MEIFAELPEALEAPRERRPVWLRRFTNRFTLTQQWIIATLLALLPLMFAVAYAGWALTEQTREQRALMTAVNGLKALDGAVERQVAGLERAARQYFLIREPRLLQIYQERVLAMEGFERDLTYTLPMTVSNHALPALVEKTHEIGHRLQAGLDTIDEAWLNQSWQEANKLRALFSQQMNRVAEAALSQNEARFHHVVQRLLFLGALAIPGTLLLVSLSTITMVRPLKRLSQSIQRLGHHRWDEPVQIEGPADFAALGEHLEWMRQQLLQADRQKEAFVRHMTHELKSPLAAIVQAEALLSDQIPGPVSDAQRRVLDILRRNAANLSDLIQQLLNYNVVKHGLILEHQKVDVAELCQKLRNQLAAIPTNEAVQWHCHGSPAQVVTDYTCLEMILRNLLSNACSALAGAGKIEIRWGAQQQHWWLAVEDNGPGIAEDELQHIFKPFYQGKKRRQGSLKGSGIGLSIVGECLALLGGSITVDSRAGATQFLVRLPMLKGDGL